MRIGTLALALFWPLLCMKAPSQDAAAIACVHDTKSSAKFISADAFIVERYAHTRYKSERGTELQSFSASGMSEVKGIDRFTWPCRAKSAHVEATTKV